MRLYGTFLTPPIPERPGSSQGRAWTRTMSTQSSDSDEEITETRAILWEVIHLHHDLPSTARADANFVAAMVGVLAFVLVGVYGGLSVAGVTDAFRGMIHALFEKMALGW